MKQFPFAILACLALSQLTACAPHRPDDTRAGICNELNSKIIFTGSTANKRQADIQNAEEPLVQRTYDRDKCYQN